MERTARAGEQPGWLRWPTLRLPWEQSLYSNGEALWKEQSKQQSGSARHPVQKELVIQNAQRSLEPSTKKAESP